MSGGSDDILLGMLRKLEAVRDGIADLPTEVPHGELNEDLIARFDFVSGNLERLGNQLLDVATVCRLFRAHLVELGVIPGETSLAPPRPTVPGVGNA